MFNYSLILSNLITNNLLFKTLENNPQHYIHCNSCIIDSCNINVNLPEDNINCTTLQTNFNEINDYFYNNFSKETSYCKENINEFICKVYIEPITETLNDICEKHHNYYNINKTIKDITEKSYCSSNKYCNNLSECSAYYNINCQKDYELLPYINDETNELENKNELCSINEDDDENLKEKFKTYVKDNKDSIIVSTIICGIYLIVLLIIIIIILKCCCCSCCKKKNQNKKEQN